MPTAQHVIRTAHEVSFTRQEIEERLAGEIRKQGLHSQFDQYSPHFRWDGSNCTVVHYSSESSPAPRAEHEGVTL